jgi:hypothetical protein
VIRVIALCFRDEGVGLMVTKVLEDEMCGDFSQGMFLGFRRT